MQWFEAFHTDLLCGEASAFLWVQKRAGNTVVEALECTVNHANSCVHGTIHTALGVPVSVNEKLTGHSAF